VSRKTFYEHFVDKEACFLAAYAWTVEQLLGEIEAAIEANPDPFAAAAAGIRAYLGFLAAHPAAARTFLIEVLAAGHEALERRSEVHQRFAEEHAAVHEAGRRLFEGVPPAPRHRLRACVGAIDALVTEHVRRYGAATVPQLAGQVLDVMLGLLVGDERAVVLQAELRRRAEEKSSGA
jgi:AcrR family transcriptional regulator